MTVIKIVTKYELTVYVKEHCLPYKGYESVKYINKWELWLKLLVKISMKIMAFSKHLKYSWIINPFIWLKY